MPKKSRKATVKTAKRALNPKKKKATKAVKKAATFNSSQALFRHLQLDVGEIPLRGAISRIAGNDHHVAFSPNGDDWVALPVKQISQARMIGAGPLHDDQIVEAGLVMRALTEKEQENFWHMTAAILPGSASNARAPNFGPPPICPVGQIPRWVVDHWECKNY